MTYRVYSGPPGSETVSPLEKERLLYKEFAELNDALGFARHLKRSGHVPLLIEGDDATLLDRHDIAAMLHGGEAA